MQKIVPHLWFDTEAGEAAEFYTSLFGGSRINDRTTLHDTPSGTVELITIDLAGQEFMLLSAGPYFKFTPAVSFLVACNSVAEVEHLWAQLSEGGSALMPLDTYAFSERWGWVMDRFGLTWQVMFHGDLDVRQKITPTLMFVGDVYGKAEEAIHFYTSVFGHAHAGSILRYGEDEAPNRLGTIKFAAFTLEGQGFANMDNGYDHDFTFNEAISFVVNCDTQAEIDAFWAKLSAVPDAEQCGWLKDRYGVSWQIVPTIMNEMMRDKDPEKLARVTAAFLKMKKFDIGELQRAYEG